jgi:curved DNA-binding protein CbpA
VVTVWLRLAARLHRPNGHDHERRTFACREQVVSLKSVSFDVRAARAMRAAYEDEKDGALICETSEAKRLVFFESGHLVGAKSDLVCEKLGEVMVARGKISRAQLDEATRFIRSGQKLGHIMVELGYLKGGEIETYVRLQIIQIASAILLSTPERIVFSEVVPIEAVTLSPVTIGDVFLEASKHLTDVDLYRKNVLIDDHVVAQTEDAVALAPGMNLTPEEAHVLDLVDGRNVVSDVLSRSALAPEKTLRLLVALHQSGILALKGERAAAQSLPVPEPPEPVKADPFEIELTETFNQMQCQNHWQVLGLGRNASSSEIERAYQDLSKRFDPVRHRQSSDAVQEKISFVATRLKEAFVTLSSRTSTKVYDRLVDHEGQYEKKRETWETIAPAPVEAESRTRPKNPEEARSLFQQAKRAYREQDFWRTIELCRSAVELSDDNDPELFHLLGVALSENPRWRQDAEKNLSIAHKLKPWEPRYLVALAKLYEKVGLHQRARRTYEQVRAVDPMFSLKEGLEGGKPAGAGAPDAVVVESE